jgi:cytochrome P450
MFTDISGIVASEIGPMRDRWAKADKIDIAAEMMHLVIAISARILFSSSVDATRVETALAVLLDDTWRRLEAPLDPSMISPRFHRKTFKDAVQTIDDVIYELIAQRRASTKNPDDLLSRLLAAHEAEGDTRLSDQELRDAAVTLLLGGHETTANALAWAFHSVAQNPDAGFESQDPAHIFAEAIRLYPSIWIIERRAIHDDTIGGFTIPRGSSMLISPHLIHRHPTFWNDPETFDPTRHAAETDRPRHAYIPFGLGQHRCVGLHMARAIATQVISQTYARYRLRPAGPTPDIEPKVTLRPKGAMWLRVHPV